MNRHKLKSENLNNIKNSFLGKINSDADYRADSAPHTRRNIRKSVVLAAATVVVIISTAIYAAAVGFDPMLVWRNLFEQEPTEEAGEQTTPIAVPAPVPGWRGVFEQEAAVVVNKQIVSSGISMDVRNLYTDGNKAVLEMTLRDLEGDRLSKDISIVAFDYGKYSASVIDSIYNAETGAVTCIVRVDFVDNASMGDSFTFTVQSIHKGMANVFVTEYIPFDFDLFDAAMNSTLKPSVSDDEWAASAFTDPVPAFFIANPHLQDDEYVYSRRGETASPKWLPLDTTVEGEELIHWLSVLGVGYEDGYLHLQYRFNNVFGNRRRWMLGDPAIIDNDGNIIVNHRSMYDDSPINDEIIYCGYKEQRLYVGSIEELRNYRLAWSGSFVRHSTDGDWSVDIDLTGIGGFISGSTELTDHPDFTSASFKLSPMYLEVEIGTNIELPDFSLFDPFDGFSDGSRAVLDWRIRLIKVYERELAIVLHDGSKIRLVARRPLDNSSGIGFTGEYPDELTGMTRAKSWLILNGGFDIEDVAKVIIFGVVVDLTQ